MLLLTHNIGIVRVQHPPLPIESKLENGNITQASIVTLNDILNHLGYALDMKALNPFAT
jgi:hypothetical protein